MGRWLRLHLESADYWTLRDVVCKMKLAEAVDICSDNLEVVNFSQYWVQ